MVQSVKRSVGNAPRIKDAMDMPEVEGQCAFAGGYVNNGDTVCWFGVEYVCRAPKLVRTGKSCT